MRLENELEENKGPEKKNNETITQFQKSVYLVVNSLIVNNIILKENTAQTFEITNEETSVCNKQLKWNLQKL